MSDEERRGRKMTKMKMIEEDEEDEKMRARMIDEDEERGGRWQARRKKMKKLRLEKA